MGELTTTKAVALRSICNLYRYFLGALGHDTSFLYCWMQHTVARVDLVALTDHPMPLIALLSLVSIAA